MCHPEVPAGTETPAVKREEVEVPLPGGERLPALFCSPEGGSGPGVMLINDIMGRSPFYESLAARMATAGFNVLLPEFFFREGPLAERALPLALERMKVFSQERALRDLNAGIEWLKRHDGVSGSRIGTIGFCLGGTYVLILQARRPDLAGVCYYGFPAASGGAPSPISLAGTMKAPLIGFWGDQDAGVGMPNVERMDQALTSRNVEHRFTVYPGLGHGFMAASALDPDHEAYEKACEAWTETLDFYRSSLA